ncbi:hypothetical protein FSP39_009246 [Pinctada imbricata]|uniref:HTH CENPB-type domain-containing protein n=1 Tax=Pinctada imbricata TaxID=66713 RepID=A0AA88XI90_PINIB|nr:hypothetical protein FSP39_009246 [Pinctada imbricata]
MTEFQNPVGSLGEQSSEGPRSHPGGITGSPAPTAQKKGTKRKLDLKTYETKYDAIMEVERGSLSKKQVAEKFAISASTLSTWLKNADSIKEKVTAGNVEPQRKKNRAAKFPEVEDALLKWFANARTHNVTVSGEMMREKARDFALKLGVPDSEFDCSVGWLERFKARHAIVFKRVCGESNDVATDSVALSDWKSKLATILKDYSASDVFNADETGIFYKLMPDKTLEFKSVSCHGGKQSKERLTVMVAANMSGTEKLPLMVIGKSANPRCFKNVKRLPTDYKSNKKAWMTSEIFTEWARKLDLQMSKQKRKICLVIDNCPAHPHIKSLKATTIVFLPPNTTSVTQPMDQGIIRNLKVFYRKFVVQRKLRAIDTNSDFTLTVLDALRMLHQAWRSVTMKTIANCYRHAGFAVTEPDQVAESNDDDDDDDPDDDLPLASLMNVAPGVSMSDFAAADDDVPTCADLSDDDIIEGIVSARNDNDDESDDEEPAQPPTRPTIYSALDAFDTLRSFFDAHNGGDRANQALADLNSMMVDAHLTKTYTRQTAMTDYVKRTDRAEGPRE